MAAPRVRKAEELQRSAAEDTEALRAALVRLLRGELILGRSAPNLNEISRRMGRAEGYVSHVVSGRMELKVEHIMMVLAAMGLSPAEFFAAVYGLGEAKGGPEEDDQILETVRRALVRLGVKPQ